VSIVSRDMEISYEMGIGVSTYIDSRDRMLGRKNKDRKFVTKIQSK